MTATKHSVLSNYVEILQIFATIISGLRFPIDILHFHPAIIVTIESYLYYVYQARLIN